MRVRVMPAETDADEHKPQSAEHLAEVARTGFEQTFAAHKSFLPEVLFAARQIARNFADVLFDPILGHADILDFSESFTKAIDA